MSRKFLNISWLQYQLHKKFTLSEFLSAVSEAKERHVERGLGEPNIIAVWPGLLISKPEESDDGRKWCVPQDENSTCPYVEMEWAKKNTIYIGRTE